MSDFTNRLFTLFSAYTEYLGRFPDQEGFQDHFASSCPTEKLPIQIMQSDECRRVNRAVHDMKERLDAYAGRRRILLFGAFGNGNLGDRIMAQTVADHLEAEGGTVCFAYSQLQSAVYPFASDRRLAEQDMPLNPRVMALFDAMVIGGGGMLSYTHEPLWDPAWPYTVPIPYGLLSCGVKVPLDGRLDNLVRRAAVASSRDEAGYVELARARDDALLCPDPILSFSTRAEEGPTPSRGCLYVLRAPFCDLHRELKDRLGPDDAVAVFEAHMDHDIVSWFENVHPVNTGQEFSKLASAFQVVVTERYHGAILAVLAGVPVYGICRNDHTDKIVSLFAELGIAHRCMAMAQVPDHFAPYDIAPVDARLQSLRAGAGIRYREFLDRLLGSALPWSDTIAAFAPAGQARLWSGAADFVCTTLPVDVEGQSMDVEGRLASMGRAYDAASASLKAGQGILASARNGEKAR